MKDLMRTNLLDLVEHLHARNCHKEEKEKRRQGFGSENMEEYIIRLKEWMKIQWINPNKGDHKTLIGKP